MNGDSDKWTIYFNDKEERWRWRRTAPNGEIVGASHQSYKNKDDCMDNAKRMGLISRHGIRIKP